MSADHPGVLRRIALRAFRYIPPRPSHAIVRALSPTYSMGAAAIIEHEGHLLALRQEHRSGWSLPGGLVDRGELPHESVVREVREETGLVVTSGDVFATVVDPDLRHVDVIYRIRCATRPSVHVASEATAAEWFLLEELPDPDGPTRRIIAAVRHAERAPEAGSIVGSPEG
ncbi:NUDIX domain-containing protein [Demetria terragena]|uniref:NUDIX domain-containing protein n=1 Tax=Demetria terragena TaxID=63959 RepID=UPI0003690D1D|nr:NUDIX domain-containing protein [Demetria terragena]